MFKKAVPTTIKESFENGFLSEEQTFIQKNTANIQFSY